MLQTQGREGSREAGEGSREAAKECSPGRKPWGSPGEETAPKGRESRWQKSDRAFMVGASLKWTVEKGAINIAAGFSSQPFFRPFRAISLPALDPGLTPWATFFGRFAAGLRFAIAFFAFAAARRFVAGLRSVAGLRDDPRLAVVRNTFSLRRNIGFAIILLLVLPGCARNSGEQEPAVPVQVVSVEQKTIQHTITAEAILFPLQQAAITSKISAPVKKFYVQRGSRVHQGQLLAILENRDLSAAAQENKGTYDQAQAAYATTTASDLPQEVQKAQLDTQAARELFAAQQKIYSSREDLFKQGAMPRKELDQAGVDLTNARNQYELAQKHLDALLAVGKQQALKSAAGQLESAQGKYLGATAQLSYSEVRSPINGVVTDRPLYPGEMAAAGTALLTVMDTSQVIAKAHIPQPEAALLKVGDQAVITVPGETNPVEGKITVVSPALDPNSTTVEIWVQTRNKDGRLKPGTSVQLAMLAQTIPNTLVIPATGLLTGQDGATSVMQVDADSHAHKNNIKVGIRQGDQVQVTEGLQAGDHIVASGAYGLPDNAKVKAESPNEQ
jgi:multidrug efflux pump subunit AcrA (membrane-fusion protein)